MSFSVGIVGLPNVGKSTLFKALTKKQVDMANYPFCTIDPNVGVVAVPDERLEKLAKIENSKKIVSTTIEFVDIAGLVKNAHQGEGLGNQFLANIREVDAIVQVLRYFPDSNVVHVSNKVEPLSDREVINLELMMADLQSVSKRLDKAEKEAKSGDKEAIKLRDLLIKVKNQLEAGKMVIDLELLEEEKFLIKGLSLLTAKPVLYVLNSSEEQLKDQASLPDELKKINPILINAKIESELADLSFEEAQQLTSGLGISETGLDKLIREAYKILNLITFLTAGEKESRAWTIQKGTLAPQAAGVIHTDFEKAFIRAEVINWQELVDAGSWAKAKELGKVREEGKDYEMQDGDTVIFKVGV